MTAIEEIKNGKGYITIFDPKGKYALFVIEVAETDTVKLKQKAKDEEKRVTDLYNVYENTTKHLLNKILILPVGGK